MLIRNTASGEEVLSLRKRIRGSFYNKYWNHGCREAIGTPFPKPISEISNSFSNYTFEIGFLALGVEIR